MKRYVASVLCVVLVYACADPASVPDSIVLSPSSYTFHSVLASHFFEPRDAQGRAIPPALVQWSSSDTRIAIVTREGGVQALHNGQATIRASLPNGLFAEVSILVEQRVRWIGLISGDGQAGMVTDTLAGPLVAELRDSLDHPIRGGPPTVVTFTSGNGVTVPPTVTVDSLGRAASRWVLGTVAGTSATNVSAEGAPSGFWFTATVLPGPPRTMIKYYGDQQTGLENATLQYELSVRVTDAFDNNVPNYLVHYVVTSGGGAVTSPTVLTNEYGRAETRWTVGPVGPQSLEAQGSTSLVGAPIPFGAEAVAFWVTGVAPDSVVEGGTATIMGGGFDPTPANNSVVIGGVPATVIAALPNALTVTVPDLHCEPSPAVSVRVTVGGVVSNAVFPPLRPPHPVNLAVGQQLIVLGSSSLCVHFPASGSPSRYIIGVQSVSGNPAAITATRSRGRNWFPVAATAMPPAAVLPTPRPPATGYAPDLDSDRMQRWARHRQAEILQRESDRQLLDGLASVAPLVRSSTSAALLDSTRQVGDTIRDLRVWTGAGDCGVFRAITAVVRARGQRGYWLEDVANPTGGYLRQDVDSLSRFFDRSIFQTDTSYFGSPTDADANRRVVVLITKEVNLRGAGLLGFVLSCDFFQRAVAPTSNEGEFFYARAPDPQGVYGTAYARADALADAPLLIAHEVTHIIQFSRRIPTGGEFSSWLFEGQATLAEELNGFAVTGRQPGGNHGFAVAFNTPQTSQIDWHVPAFVDLAVYFGFESPTTRRLGAPHECTWIGRRAEGNTGPCLPGREVYGVAASLYRWASDRFGSAYPGGERGLQKAITGNPLGGYDNLASVTGHSIDSLLAQWAAALYVDDRIPGLDPRVSFTTWNMLNVFNGLVETARLVPHDVGFGPFDVTKNIRAGSTAFLQISGNYRAVTAVRVRDALDGILLPHINLWIVRLE